MHRRVTLVLFVSVTLLDGCTPGRRAPYAGTGLLPDAWRTHAERTDFVETGRYSEAVDFCRRLAAASPLARYTSFGVSGEGRELPLLILSQDRAFTPAAARQSQKPVVLIQCCIHAGECEGKDASLLLAREIVLTGERADLLNRAIVLVIPIFNVDGHERFGPYNRINQNGPREMGWRTTAANLNLNRDYVKADAVEMQAWLRLWTAWQPDLFIDTHTTDGHDHGYDVFYAVTDGPDVAAPVAAWTRDVLLPGIMPALDAGGLPTLPYSSPRDPKDPSQGISATTPMSPRLSNGYAAVCNRPAILVETHSLKPYGRRVHATHDLLALALQTVNQHADDLRTAVRTADDEAVRRRGATQDDRVPLRFEPTDAGRPIVFKAVEQRLHASEISGSEIIEYLPAPRDVETNLYDQARSTLAVTPPAAYLIPPQWHEVIARLELHGVQFFRLKEPQTLAVESYRFDDVHFREAPYESRQIPTFKTIPTTERRDFIAGTVVVPLNQPRARLAAHLLEPDGPDSFVAWGFFNTIFEQKEYFEAYVMEPLARQMRAADSDLKAEFEAKLASDEAFAKDPGRRLEFFYRRSPYWDSRFNVYPVARLMDAAELGHLRP